MDAKELCVVICNYNKKDYLLKNIESLNEQTFKNFDICVVDNASSDGSAEAVEARCPEVKIIRNKKNLGGSGGFNTGMRYAVDRKYKFIMLLDNDVIVDMNTIKQLYDDMSVNDDIGIMGAKILKMDQPNIIQEFAPTINYHTMTFELNHGGEPDDRELPHFAECDYVPACALVIRSELILRIGYMPEENFIYYDDIEWGIRCWRAGYRVVANSKALVWHKGGAGVNPTTFGTYYLNRNKLRFFMTYMQTRKPKAVGEDDIKGRIESILRDAYEGVYSCERHGMFNVARTRMDGFLDALNMLTGRAFTFEIRPREDMDSKFDLAVRAAKNIRIYMHGNWEGTRRILNYIKLLNGEEKKLPVELTDDSEYSSNKLLGVDIRDSSVISDDKFDLVLHVCSHIYELKIDSFDRKWIDGWRNTILDEADFENYRGFEHSYRIFKLSFEERVRNTMMKLGGDYANV